MSSRNLILCRRIVIITLLVCATNTALADAPSIVTAQSVKNHGTADDLAVDIPLGGDGTESREGGPTKLIVMFDQDVYAAGGLDDVWLSSGTVDSVTAVGNVVTVTLSGVSNAAVLSVAFPGIENGSGETCEDTLWIRALTGDAYSDGTVDIFDLLQARINLGQPVIEANCLCDVNLDSEIGILDLVTVRVNLNKTAAPGGMALIPAGEFQMGDTFSEGSYVELPVHAVYVDAFYMDRYEVTNQQYADALNWAKNQGNLITVRDGTVYKYSGGPTDRYCHTTASTYWSRITWNGSAFGSFQAGKPTRWRWWAGTALWLTPTGAAPWKESHCATISLRGFATIVPAVIGYRRRRNGRKRPGVAYRACDSPGRTAIISSMPGPTTTVQRTTLMIRVPHAVFTRTLTQACIPTPAQWATSHRTGMASTT